LRVWHALDILSRGKHIGLSAANRLPISACSQEDLNPIGKVGKEARLVVVFYSRETQLQQLKHTTRSSDIFVSPAARRDCIVFLEAGAGKPVMPETGGAPEVVQNDIRGFWSTRDLTH